jgi:hypothetical protein
MSQFADEHDHEKEFGNEPYQVSCPFSPHCPLSNDYLMSIGGGMKQKSICSSFQQHGRCHNGIYCREQHQSSHNGDDEDDDKDEIEVKYRHDFIHKISEIHFLLYQHDNDVLDESHNLDIQMYPKEYHPHPIRKCPLMKRQWIMTEMKNPNSFKKWNYVELTNNIWVEIQQSNYKHIHYFKLITEDEGGIVTLSPISYKMSDKVILTNETYRREDEWGRLLNEGFGSFVSEEDETSQQICPIIQVLKALCHDNPSLLEEKVFRPLYHHIQSYHHESDISGMITIEPKAAFPKVYNIRDMVSISSIRRRPSHDETGETPKVPLRRNSRSSGTEYEAKGKRDFVFVSQFFLFCFTLFCI